MGCVYDVDSDGLARPKLIFDSYEEARERVDVFNESNARGYNRNFRPKRDRARDSLYNNSSDGVRGTSENVSPVAKGESKRNGIFETSGQNNRPQDSVGGASVDSDGFNSSKLMHIFAVGRVTLRAARTKCSASLKSWAVLFI